MHKKGLVSAAKQLIERIEMYNSTPEDIRLIADHATELATNIVAFFEKQPEEKQPSHEGVCEYFAALQKIGAKLDASKDGRISSSYVREYLEDTVSAEMIDEIIEPLPSEDDDGEEENDAQV